MDNTNIPEYHERQAADLLLEDYFYASLTPTLDVARAQAHATLAQSIRLGQFYSATYSDGVITLDVYARTA